MFRPPTEGYEETPLVDAIMEHLIPDKSGVKAVLADRDLTIANISKGDAVTVEFGRQPKTGNIGLVDYQGDQFFAIWHWHRGRWYVQTDDRKGRVTEDMLLIGIAQHIIKNQLD